MNVILSHVKGLAAERSTVIVTLLLLNDIC